MMAEPIPGLSPELACHPVMVKCAKLAKKCNKRKTPKCDSGYRSGDGPPPHVVRAIMPDFDKVQ